MKTESILKINIDTLSEKIIELLKQTQEVDMFSGWKKYLLLDPETGELFFSDWWSVGTWTETYIMLYGREAWSIEDVVDMDEYYDDPDFKTKEIAYNAAVEDLYGNEVIDWAEHIIYLIELKIEEENLNIELI